MKVAIYLRKSRADEEVEKKLGEGETLARHRKALLKLAKERSYTVVKIHEELVSGEELFFRPAMLELLKEIEQGLYDAVLVMDIQRLGRGDMEEQGIILKTFKNTGTKIITPQKTYDLSNEFDEEYSEFEAFMSRKEYKMITRRMQGGRVRSVEEGNYIATRPPYGYDVKRIDKRTRILVPNPEQSKVIKMMFEWYTSKNMGCGMIADELNRLGIKSYTGGLWERTSITTTLKNQTYIGKIVWKKKCIRKSKTPGKKKDVYTREKEDWVIADGKHEAIVDIDVFNRAQEILLGRYHAPYHIVNGVVNPMAGLIYCSVCGSKMKRRPYKNKEAHILCEKRCVKSNKFASVESAIIGYLQDYLKKLDVEQENNERATNEHKEVSAINEQKKSLQNELKTLETQKLKTYDLLEQGVYDVNTFTNRLDYISKKIDEVNSSIQFCDEQVQQLSSLHIDKSELAKRLRNVLDFYSQSNDVMEKNMLIKSVLDKVVYYKEKTCKSDEFRIKVFPKMLIN